MEDKQSGWINALRWAVFVPGGLAMGVLIALVWLLLMLLNNWLTLGYMVTPLVMFVASGAVGWATVFVGCKIAPSKNKMPPAIVMAVIVAGFFALAALANIAESKWFGLVQCVITAAAAIISAVVISSDPEVLD